MNKIVVVNELTIATEQFETVLNLTRISFLWFYPI